MTKNIFLSLIVSLFSLTALAAPTSPALGSKKAVKGGTLYHVFGVEPETLNPLTSSGAYAGRIQNFVLDSLMVRNDDTYKFEARLAKSVVEAKDGMSATVTIRTGVTWSDGKPLTVEDVKFSYESRVNGKFDNAHYKMYYENIESATIINPTTLVFKFNKKYFGNYSVVAGLQVVPKHFYKDPKKKLNKTILGSGPYKMDKYKKGKSIQLIKNKNWWGWKESHLKNIYNPEKLLIRFVKDENVQLEMLKKGRIDFLPMTPEIYTKKAVGKLWGSKVKKQKVKHLGPKGYGFVAWNLKNDLFKNKDVRVALTHLMNRELMIKKFRYGMSLPATGPWYQQSPFASKNVKPLAFSPKKAKALLKSAGWSDSDKNGTLDKVINGKKKEFKFTLMFANKDIEKYFTVYKEDLKKSGINMELKIIEWNSFIKALDSRKFEAVNLGWGGGAIENDPKQIWHSSSYKNKGSNFIGYNNPKVDKLIDEGRKVLDYNKRIKIWNQIYELIAADAPYAFMFNDNFNFYGHTSRMAFDKPVYKYSVGNDYWWITK